MPWPRPGPRALVLLLALLGSAQAVAAEQSPPPRGIDPKVSLSELVLKQWTTADGLPTNSLVNVTQISTGELWISGFGGLARFDGNEFEVFSERTVPELEAGSFYGVVEDGTRLWIASQGRGVWGFDGRTFSALPASEPRASIRALCVDRQGDLWIGAADQGVYRWDGERTTAIGNSDLRGASVRAIFEDSLGSLWFGTEGAGLFRLADGRFTSFTKESGLAGDSVTSVIESTTGALWIGTQRGLSRFSGGVMSTFPELEGVEIFRLIEDEYGSLWIAAEQGLFRHRAREKGFEHLQELDGLSLRSINGIAFDNEGGVWIASYTSGLLRLQESQFRNYTTADGLSSRRVNSVFEWDRGRFLVGGDLGAIHLIEDERVSRFGLQTELPEVRVRDFFKDGRGTLWISSYAGLLRISDGKETLLTTESGLPVNEVRLVFEDSAGRLWVGTRGGGVARLLDAGGFEVIDRSKGLASDFVLALAEDANGRLLIGTQSGLSVLGTEGSITHYGAAEGLPGELIFNLFVDDKNAVWIATTGGLARLSEGEIRSLGVREGLPTEAIYDFHEDDLGYAWMTSGNGVLRVAKHELEELMAGNRRLLEPQIFDETEGMEEAQCTGATDFLVASDGSLWIPTLGGLSVIDPGRVSSVRVAPPVLIRRLTIDGEQILRPAQGNAVIEVGPGRRRFDFSFAALSFRAPEKVDLRYRLEGFDAGWIDAGAERMARYTGLPPGRYTFRVAAFGEDGSLGDQQAALRLRVKPHFYQSSVFWILLAATLVAGPWTFYRRRAVRARRRSEELEKLLVEQERLEKERTQLIRELESRNEQLEHLTYAVSHDLKSPLFTIRGFLGLLEKDRADGDEAAVTADIGRIREAAAAMSRLLEELLKLWRVENAEMVLEEVGFGDLARQAVANVQGHVSERGIEVEIAPDLPRVLVEPTRMTEVVQNLVENAARFMGEQSEPRIVIGCREDGGTQAFFVRDNGIGIEPHFHARVFRIFEQLKASPQGTGLGLAIVKRAIEAHGGRVWIESEGGGMGSTFWFTLGRPAAPPMA